MKSKTTLKLVSGMRSLPLGKTAGKKPIARSKASPKGQTAPLPPKISRTHKPDGVALEDWQRALRKQFGEQQPFILENVGGHPLFSEFALTNPESGKTYRIAIRGEAPGMNYCSCPDFTLTTWAPASISNSPLRSCRNSVGRKNGCERGTPLHGPRSG